MKNNGMIIGVVVAVIVAGGGFYAWNAGLLNFDYQIPTQTEIAREETTAEQQSTTETVEVPEETVGETQTVGTPVPGRSFTVEEAEAKPTLCEQDSDCKVQLITCNQCDCGRGVNTWIEDYACTDADRANSCGIVCPPSKAVCDNGVCKKVAA